MIVICDVYPNVDIALLMYLSIPATNCSGERSFSTLKRVKNYLCASMNQDRLNALALLFIEAQLVQKLEYNDVIDVFAQGAAYQHGLRAPSQSNPPLRVIGTSIYNAYLQMEQNMKCHQILVGT